VSKAKTKCRLHTSGTLRGSEESGNKCAETGKYVGENDLLQNVIKKKNQTPSQYNTFHCKKSKMMRGRSSR
jgi:hypothetical protein